MTLAELAERPPVYRPVRNIVAYITYRCPLRCDYCWVDKTDQDMTRETARQVIEYAYSGAVSGGERDVNITFFGGEPFLVPDTIEYMLGVARERRPNVYKKATFCATTSGTIATPAVERLIKDARMPLLISLDGNPHGNAERKMASGRPSYEHVARNLPRLVSWSPQAVARMTFHPKALDLVGNVRHVLELGAPSVALCPVEESDWEPHREALEEAYQALADWYISEARQGRLPLEITNMLLTDWHHAQQGGARPPRPCGVGNTLLGIDVAGHVMPCHRFLYRAQDRLGHVREPMLPLERLRYMHLSSADVLGCDTCAAEPVCGGGCRAVVVNGGRPLESGATPGYCLTTRAHVAVVRRIYDTLMAEQNAPLLRLFTHGRTSALTALYTQ